MKALELTIHPKRLVATGFVRWNGDGTSTDLHVEEWLVDGEWLRSPFRTHKRLTDTEIAAEFHKSASDFMSANGMDLLFDDADSASRLERARVWMFHMESFATRPHYDEATA